MDLRSLWCCHCHGSRGFVMSSQLSQSNAVSPMLMLTTCSTDHNGQSTKERHHTSWFRVCSRTLERNTCIIFAAALAIVILVTNERIPPFPTPFRAVQICLANKWRCGCAGEMTHCRSLKANWETWEPETGINSNHDNPKRVLAIWRSDNLIRRIVGTHIRLKKRFG